MPNDLTPCLIATSYCEILLLTIFCDRWRVWYMAQIALLSQLSVLLLAAVFRANCWLTIACIGRFLSISKAATCWRWCCTILQMTPNTEHCCPSSVTCKMHRVIIHLASLLPHSQTFCQLKHFDYEREIFYVMMCLLENKKYEIKFFFHAVLLKISLVAASYESHLMYLFTKCHFRICLQKLYKHF